IIKPSNFVNPEDLGEVVNRQLYQKINEANTVVIGFDDSNAYQSALVKSIVANFPQTEGRTSKSVILVSAEDSFSGNPLNKQNQLRLENKNPQIYFTIFDLGDGPVAQELKNCELLKTYDVWIDCKKKQKLRQISKAKPKKVNQEQTVALMDVQSSKDIVVYISER